MWMKLGTLPDVSLPRHPLSCEYSQMREEQVMEPRGEHPMSTTTQARFRAAIVAIAPAVLLFAFVYHPYIANLTDKAAVAAALASDTTRWGLSHLAVGVGSGLAVLAFLAIRGYLREAGALSFALGVFGFAVGIVRSGVLGPRLTWLVVGALFVMAAARFVPLGAAIYVGGLAGIVALWPLAYEMWKHPEPARPAGQPRPMPAT